MGKEAGLLAVGQSDSDWMQNIFLFSTLELLHDTRCGGHDGYKINMLLEYFDRRTVRKEFMWGACARRKLKFETDL
jgi:hypothetical protein